MPWKPRYCPQGNGAALTRSAGGGPCSRTIARVRGVPITIRCDCGDARPVHYGERWTCAACGRTWNTAQVPAEEYWGLMRDLRRYRLIVWGITAIIVGTLVPLAVIYSFGLFVFVILGLGALYFLVLPRWRSRIVERIRDRPTWKLMPE